MNGNGSISPAAGAYTCAEGTMVTVTAAPSAGWQFSHWSGDASGSANPIAVIMSTGKNIAANLVLQGTSIAAIKANPTGYDGQEVKIIGEFRGPEGGYGAPP